jgi:hypothetical protein
MSSNFREKAPGRHLRRNEAVGELIFELADVISDTSDKGI